MLIFGSRFKRAECKLFGRRRRMSFFFHRSCSRCSCRRTLNVFRRRGTVSGRARGSSSPRAPRLPNSEGRGRAVRALSPASVSLKSRLWRRGRRVGPAACARRLLAGSRVVERDARAAQLCADRGAAARRGGDAGSGGAAAER